MIDYINSLPIKADIIPDKLKKLLSPISKKSDEHIELACEYLTEDAMSYYMTTVAVPIDKAKNLKLLYLDNGVVTSGPDNDGEGMCRNNYTVDGYDSIISSWGDGSFFTYNLSDKVWMTLGLTPRCLNNDAMAWDDLANYVLDIAKGELSTEYHYESTRNVSWKMRNDYLRKYLWHIGCVAARTFWYEEYLPRSKELEELIGEKGYFQDENNDKWYDVRLHVNEQYAPDKIRIEIRATVIIADPELCEEKTINGIIWPDIKKTLTKQEARKMHFEEAYFSDNLLKVYENDDKYTIIPDKGYISYRGQWAFRDCRRVKRNYISMPYRKIYEGLDVSTIIKINQFAVTKEEVENAENLENIASKVIRFKDEFLLFGEYLSKLLYHLSGDNSEDYKIIKISKKELEYKGWYKNEQLFKLAKTAPLNMNEYDFLNRCKTLSEFFNMPIGHLKNIILSSGINKKDIEDFKSIKLLHVIKNVLDYLSENALKIDDFKNCSDRFDWKNKNETMRILFIINDLRQIDAHEKPDNPLKYLEQLGFDTALCVSGYGKALDFICDGVIDTLKDFNSKCKTIFG